MSSIEETLARLEERVIFIHEDVREIKGNGKETKKRLHTIETKLNTHSIYFKAVPYTLGILGTLTGLTWFFLRVL